MFCCCDCRSDSNTIDDSEDSEDKSSSEEAEQIDTDEDADADDDADDFQQPVRRRSAKSAYEVDVSDSEHASDSEPSPAKARSSHRLQKGNSSKAKSAAPVRRQPSRTAAVKASLAESSSNSDQDTSSAEPEKGSNRKRTGLSSDQAAVKRRCQMKMKIRRTSQFHWKLQLSGTNCSPGYDIHCDQESMCTLGDLLDC